MDEMLRDRLRKATGDLPDDTQVQVTVRDLLAAIRAVEDAEEILDLQDQIADLEQEVKNLKTQVANLQEELDQAESITA